MRFSVFAFAFFALAQWFSPPAMATNLVLNGSFENFTVSAGDYFCKTGTGSGATSVCTVSNVANWQTRCSTTGGCGTTSTVASLIPSGTGGSGFNNGNALGASVPNSPDGGNFVAIDGDSAYGAPIWQVISGLMPGNNYVVTFYQAAAQQANAPSSVTTEWWNVTFAGVTKSSTVMTNPNRTSYQPWALQTLSFYVPITSTGTETLQFLAGGTPNGVPPVSLLDGVSLVQGTPEPQSFVLVGTGLAAAIGLPRLRRRRGR